MNIIANKTTIFDNLVGDSRENAAEIVAKNAERLDAAIYAKIDHSRFAVATRRERTVMTSLGEVRFKRRVYFDSFGKSYICPLDSALGLPPRARVSPELKRALVVNASEMTYSMAARHSCLKGSVSKSTVCRAIRDCSVAAAERSFAKPAARVHLQMDEKYIGFVGSDRKKPRYTATIYTGIGDSAGGRKKLLGRTIISAESVKKLAKRLNKVLSSSYGLTINDAIWLSGDLASYIRNFKERITCCKAEYVPDKWHVCHMLSKAYPDLGEVKPKDVAAIMERISEGGDYTKLEEAGGIDLARMYEANPECFSAWSDEGYKGCSQEGMNSHYYARRFGKLAYRFKPSTVEKLCALIEARQNGVSISLAVKAEDPPALEDLPWLGKAYEDRMKYSIDTSGMNQGLRKAIDSIKYGGL